MIITTPTGQRTAHDSPHSHECHHGFCTVCGSVWPCSRALRMTTRQPIPVPRADALAR